VLGALGVLRVVRGDGNERVGPREIEFLFVGAIHKHPFGSVFHSVEEIVDDILDGNRNFFWHNVLDSFYDTDLTFLVGIVYQIPGIGFLDT